MDISLILVQKDQRQKEIKVSKDRVVIGRNTECTIRIPVASVSRQHCELIVDDGQLMLRDLKSGNGTFVNQKRITEHVCSPGDLIAVGPAVFVVRIDGEPKSVNVEGALKAGAAPEPMAASRAPAEGVTRSMSKPEPAKKAAAAEPAAPKSPAKDMDDDLEDSSLSDFDFLDEDDDGQPKL